MTDTVEWRTREGRRIAPQRKSTSRDPLGCGHWQDARLRPGPEGARRSVNRHADAYECPRPTPPQWHGADAAEV